jgi:hypothetical protein
MARPTDAPTMQLHEASDVSDFTTSNALISLTDSPVGKRSSIITIPTPSVISLFHERKMNHLPYLHRSFRSNIMEIPRAFIPPLATAGVRSFLRSCSACDLEDDVEYFNNFLGDFSDRDCIGESVIVAFESLLWNA